MEKLVKLTIDGVSVEVPAGTTVLEAAKKAGINIPTLCYLKDINQIGACRMCIVDTGARAFGAACVLPVSEGMNVKTNTPKLRAARKINLELLLSNHDKRCLDCARNQKCELQQMCIDLTSAAWTAPATRSANCSRCVSTWASRMWTSSRARSTNTKSTT